MPLEPIKICPVCRNLATHFSGFGNPGFCRSCGIGKCDITSCNCKAQASGLCFAHEDTVLERNARHRGIGYKGDGI